MEEKRSELPNRIEISEFGLGFLKQLPAELRQMDLESLQDKENIGLLSPCYRKRGQGVNFQEFAQHTQATIHREVSAVGRRREEGTGESRRKQQLHHDNWVSEQKLLRHKLADAQARAEQAKFSEYDWQRESQALRGQRNDILSRWEAAHLTRDRRLLSKLRKIMHRKYPSRAPTPPQRSQAPTPLSRSRAPLP